MGRAKGLGVVQLFLGHVHGNDAARPGDPRALNGIQAHAARADHHHILPGAQTGCVDHRPDTRDHPAGDQARRLHRDRGRDLDQLALVHHHLFGKGPAGHRLMQRAALDRADRSRIAVIGCFANGRLAARTGPAGAAGADQGDHHAVTHRQAVHVVADRTDHTRRLVAVDRRQAAAPGPAGKGNVRMADRHGMERHFDFTDLRCAQVNVLDHEGSAKFMADGRFDCLHVLPLPRALSGARLALHLPERWRSPARPASTKATIHGCG